MKTKLSLLLRNQKPKSLKSFSETLKVDKKKTASFSVDIKIYDNRLSVFMPTRKIVHKIIMRRTLNKIHRVDRR